MFSTFPTMIFPNEHYGKVSSKFSSLSTKISNSFFPIFQISNAVFSRIFDSVFLSCSVLGIPTLKLFFLFFSHVCISACKYDKGSWSKCNVNNEMTRADILRNPNESDASCEKTKLITKICKNKTDRNTKGTLIACLTICLHTI